MAKSSRAMKEEKKDCNEKSNKFAFIKGKKKK